MGPYRTAPAKPKLSCWARIGQWLCSKGWHEWSIIGSVPIVLRQQDEVVLAMDEIRCTRCGFEMHHMRVDTGWFIDIAGGFVEVTTDIIARMQRK